MRSVDELFRDPARKALAFDWDARLFSWRNFFLALDRALQDLRTLAVEAAASARPAPGAAVAARASWSAATGLAAIYPAMMNAIFALMAMGHSPDDPLTAREIGQLAQYEIEDDDTIRMQPCISPVWDTAIAMVALEEAGLPPDHPALVRAADWLLDHQVLGPGDWQVKNPGVLPGGWVFEFRNDFYPGCGRHRVRPDGAAARGLSRPRAHGGRRAPRHRRGCSHAESRWRLGRV